MSFYELLGHLTFVLVAASFLVKDIIYLRVLSILSCIFGILFNFFGFDSPVWLVIFWQSTFIVINVVQIGLSAKEKLGVKFSEEERELYDTQFGNMSPVEFIKLMRLAEWRHVGADAVLFKEDDALASVTLIYDGVVEIQKNALKIDTLRGGAFLGDVEFFSDSRASATAISTTELRLVVWPLERLRGLLQRNPSILLSLNSALGAGLASKLTKESAD